MPLLNKSDIFVLTNKNKPMKLNALLITLCLFMSLTKVHSQPQSSVTYNDGSQTLSGVLVKPAKATSKKVGVLILPAWMGIDEHSKTVAKQLAEEGYTAFVADIYGEGHYPKSPKEAGELSGHFKNNIKE